MADLIFLALARTVHFVGFAVGIGAGLAALKLHGAARSIEMPTKAGVEEAAAEVVTKVELPALFLALFGGILLIVANPSVMSPAKSGAGPWLHIKLLLVLGLLVVAHIRMFRSRRLIRERSGGATEAECESLAGAARMLGKIDLALGLGIVTLALFRFALFAG